MLKSYLFCSGLSLTARRYLNDKHRAGRWAPHSSDALQLLSPAMFTEDLSHTRDRRCERSAFRTQMMLDLCSYRVLALVGQRGTLLAVTPSAKVCVFIFKVCICSCRSSGQPSFPGKSGRVLQHDWYLNLGSVCEWKRPCGKRAWKFSRCESKNSKDIVGGNGLRSQGYGRD